MNGPRPSTRARERPGKSSGQAMPARAPARCLMALRMAHRLAKAERKLLRDRSTTTPPLARSRAGRPVAACGGSADRARDRRRTPLARDRRLGRGRGGSAPRRRAGRGARPASRRISRPTPTGSPRSTTWPPPTCWRGTGRRPGGSSTRWWPGAARGSSRRRSSTSASCTRIEGYLDAAQAYLETARAMDRDPAGAVVRAGAARRRPRRARRGAPGGRAHGAPPGRGRCGAGGSCLRLSRGARPPRGARSPSRPATGPLAVARWRELAQGRFAPLAAAAERHLAGE